MLHKFLVISIVLLSLVHHSTSFSLWNTFYGMFADVKRYVLGSCHVEEQKLNSLRGNLQGVIGQHIAREHVLWGVISHFKEPSPRHALSFVLMGTTGTGKNYISNIVAETIYGENSPFVRVFVGRRDFPVASRVEHYKEWLIREITAQVWKCPKSIFIFDEVDKMPPGLMDSVKPFLDYHSDGPQFRESAYFFLTNYGGDRITNLYRDLMTQGVTRDGLQYSHFEPLLRQLLFESEGMSQSVIVSDQLLSFYLPMLPLTKLQVVQCIERALRLNNVYTQDNIDHLLNQLEFDSHDEISFAGCKRIDDHVMILKTRYYRHNEF